MRVFSVQRVNKSFSARLSADRRTYEYYLPAHILGIDDAGMMEQLWGLSLPMASCTCGLARAQAAAAYIKADACSLS